MNSRYQKNIIAMAENAELSGVSITDLTDILSRSSLLFLDIVTKKDTASVETIAALKQIIKISSDKIIEYV